MKCLFLVQLTSPSFCCTCFVKLLPLNSKQIFLKWFSRFKNEMFCMFHCKCFMRLANHCILLLFILNSVQTFFFWGGGHCVSRTYKIEINAVTLKSSAGTSTPPSIAATPVPALPPPIAVNSYPSVPAPPNGQPATETLYTNGVHAYQGTGIASYTDYSCILRFTNLLCSIHIALNISNNIHDFFFYHAVSC